LPTYYTNVHFTSDIRARLTGTIKHQSPQMYRNEVDMVNEATHKERQHMA